MTKRSFLAVAVLTTAAFGWAASGEEDVRKAEAAWAKAVMAKDEPKLNQMLAEGLVYTHSTGSVDTKDQYLSKLKSGAQKYDGLQSSDMSVHMYGNTAVVNAKIRMTGSTNGTPFDNKLLYTHTWVKQSGHWQLVAHQTTKMP